MSEIKVTRIHSHSGCTPHQKNILAARGLRRREMVKTFQDNAAVRGMIARVSHLVEVSES